LKYVTSIGVVMLLLSTTSAWAIDCNKANTVPEKAICSNAPLKAFDKYLTDAYAELRQIIPADIFGEVIKRQRGWIKYRDKKCGGEVQCLMNETRLRTATLNGLVQDITEKLWENLLGSEPSHTKKYSEKSGAGPLTTLNPKEIYSTAAESVVVVVSYNERDGNVSQGSGVTIGSGIVATNCHVVKSENTVVLFKGLPYEVTSIAGNIKLDYCILYVASLPAKPATTATLNSVAPGQRVYSVGSPRGLNLTIAEGLVSAKSMQDVIPYIQTTAAISPGSSGGGLFDEFGRVVGITTFQLKESQNINFALPINLSKVVLKFNSD